MATTTRVTAEEFFKLANDHSRHELVRGEVVTMPPAGFAHGEDASGIDWFLESHVREHGGGQVVVEVGFTLFRDPDTVRAPDVAFVSESRLPSPGQRRKFYEGAPDLAVEVVSPDDTASEVLEKVREYLAAGTRLVWVVDRRTGSVAVYRANGTTQFLGESDTLSGEDVLPGFTVRVGDLFG